MVMYATKMFMTKKQSKNAKLCFQKYEILKDSVKGVFKEDTHGWAVAIVDEFSKLIV